MIANGIKTDIFGLSCVNGFNIYINITDKIHSINIINEADTSKKSGESKCLIANGMVR